MNRTKKQEARKPTATRLSKEARDLSRRYSTDYVDVLERPAPGRSPVVRSVPADQFNEPVSRRNN